MIKRGLAVAGTIAVVVACGSSGNPDDGGTESGADATNDVVKNDAANEAASDAVADVAADTSDACVPLADSSKRGNTCQSPADCDPGYGCIPVGAVKQCQVDCTTSSCACPVGLQCETANFDGGTSHICS